MKKAKMSKLEAIMRGLQTKLSYPFKERKINNALETVRLDLLEQQMQNQENIEKCLEEVVKADNPKQKIAELLNLLLKKGDLENTLGVLSQVNSLYKEEVEVEVEE